MLRRLIGFSLDHAGFVIAAAILLVGFAVYQLPRMPVDVFPELNAPTVVIMSEAGGRAADEVEREVTLPIESAVNGIPGVRRVRSSSAISLSIVWVEFDWGEDLVRARQMVAERLSGLEEGLPKGVHAEIAPVTSVTGEIMLISLSSPTGKVSELELRAYAEYDLSKLLLSVPGIAQVVAIGGELPEYQVNADPARLLLHDLTLQDVADAAAKAHSTATGGYIANYQGLELPIRQQARVESVDDIKGTLVKYHDGAPVTLGDVADVVLAGAPKRGTAADHARPAVVLSIQKSPGTNTMELTNAVVATLEKARATLPEGAVLNDHVFRQTDFIQLSLDNVITVLRDAAIIVAIILVLFLLNVRTTFITLTALPLSLAVSLLILWLWDMSINVMTLGGLAVAIGELVDDAIIDVENVFRRLRENAALPPEQRRGFVPVIFDASNEIRGSVVFATVIIVIVFVPLLFLEGLEGRFFQPLGIAYITSILASLIVALTVTPALCRLLLKKTSAGANHGESFLVRWLKRVYRPALKGAIKLRWPVMIGALVATSASLWFGNTFGTSFLPEFNEGTFTVFLMAPPGTSLDESNRLAYGVERRLAQIEGVKHVVRRTGRAERDQHAEPASSSEAEVAVKPGYSKEAVRKEIDKVLADIPGITTMVGQPIEHRLSHILSGTPAAIAINVYGEDLDKLRSIAKEVETALKATPGTRDVNANREVMVTTLPVRYRIADLTRWGLDRETAAEQVQMAWYGEQAVVVNQGKRRYDITVRLAPEFRATPSDLKDFMLRGKGGAHVRLSEVADVGIERASNLIARDNMSRKAIISCNVAAGFNLGHLVEAVKAKVDPIVANHGYIVTYGGQFEAQASASKTIMVMGAGVIVVIFLLLMFAFNSGKAALLVMVNLPLALIGGIVAIYLTATDDLVGNTLALFGAGEKPYVAPVISIASMVGFVTLFGIAVRNGILLVNHYQHLVKFEGKSIREAIIQGSEERLIPILMTALTAVLGLAPLVMAAGEPGSELLAPLAVVVLGGLVTSTFLNLIVVPAGYWMLFAGKDSTTTPPEQGVSADSQATQPPLASEPTEPTQGEGI
ncbi:MAG: efflux RND transporter permease subunit [Planctomycetaceae bacterium]|nr:efflux RND transporter permease subunit [Planctomycetaceae bacterium]